MVFAAFLLFLVLLRTGELLLARHNALWLRRHGAVEYGARHYPWIVLLHVAFFLSLIVEYSFDSDGSYSIPLLALYFVLLAFKAWAVLSLGRFWNTRIYRIPGYPLIRRGPYRFMKHPNYWAVAVEIALIPMIFHLYATAVVFTLLNAWMLHHRIRVENRVLAL